MGWLFYDHTPRDIEAEIARLCTGADATRSMAPALIARDGTTWYAAVRITYKSGAANPEPHYEADQDASYTFAAVFLTEISGREWGYKDMDETMGPVQCAAPAAILDLLSPTTAPYALEWRKRCRQNVPHAA